MKIFLWVAGIGLLFVIIPVLILFSNFIFRSQITQLEVNFSSEFIALMEGVKVIEKNYDVLPSDAEIPDTGDLESAREMLLYEDDSIKEGRRVFDNDPGKEVLVSFNKSRNESRVYLANNVFQYRNGHKGVLLGTFPPPIFSYIDFVLPINEKTMLVHGAMQDSPYPSERELWQVEYDGLIKTQLSHDPYYLDARPPKVFNFESDNEQVVVYYVGSYDYAFGGDSSRPKYSMMRVYNSLYPKGIDLIKFGFKAGTIIDVVKVDGGYLVTGDPSLPAMAGKARASLRQWKVVMD